VLTVDFDRLGVHHASRVLDLGSGGGRHAYEAWRRGAVVVALDVDEHVLGPLWPMALAMHHTGELTTPPAGGPVRGGAATLPFADASFDFVIASEVLEHVVDDRAATAELVRVLRPGGRIAVTVPTRWPERVCWALDRRYHDRPGGHVRIYRRAELERRLESAGLSLRGAHHAHALHSPYWWLKCAVGVDNDSSAVVRRYHDLLVWQITARPAWLGRLERILDPVLGKSLVVYAERAVG
jgi:SAM-dependent methyltransferase